MHVRTLITEKRWQELGGGRGSGIDGGGGYGGYRSCTLKFYDSQNPNRQIYIETNCFGNDGDVNSGLYVASNVAFFELYKSEGQTSSLMHILHLK